MLLGRVCTFDADTFEFITRKVIPSGMFVCYYEEDKPVLCRVCECTPLNELPPELLDAESVKWEEIMEFFGFDTTNFKLFSVKAKLIGYFDKNLGEFINPRRMPPPGTPVEEAGRDVLVYLSKVGDGEGSAYIGEVLGTDVPVYISVRDIVSQHLSVIASTGAGKSYAVGVILEEMMMPKNCASVLVLDPHGEYSSMVEIMNNQNFRSEEYRANVMVVKPEKIKVRLGDLEPEDLLSLIDDGNLSEKMRTFLTKAYYDAKENILTYSSLIGAVEALGEDKRHESTVDALRWRLEKLRRVGVLDDYRGIPLRDYFRAGRLTIVDVSGIPDSLQQLVATVLLRLLFDARKGTITGEYVEGDERYIPSPAFVVLEEAHRFAPREGFSLSKKILKTILSEGRKFGVGVCLISQRPSKIDQDVLSQCLSQITLRIVNPADQEYIAQTVESFSRDIVRELPSLPTGVAIVSGICINTPTLVRVRNRIIKPRIGQSINAPAEWRRIAQETDDRMSEVPAHKSSSIEEDLGI
ncbi:ATP-binding protein [Methanosarcinales archaeon]|nr:MAG: ATP-binding protein [Methanosarcinales archaeon]